MLRLFLAAVVSACMLQPASAAFQTFSYSGAPQQVPDGQFPNAVAFNINVPDGVVMNQFQSISVNFSVTHTWVGDVIMQLQHVESGLAVNLINGPGQPSLNGGFGDSSNLTGTYTFSNVLTLTNPAQPRIIDNASTIGDTVSVANGVYRPTDNTFLGGGAPAFSGEVITSLNATFDNMGVMTGTWRLLVADYATPDTGTISAVSFTADVSGTPAPAAVWMGLAGAGVLAGLRRRFKK